MVLFDPTTYYWLCDVFDQQFKLLKVLNCLFVPDVWCSDHRLCLLLAARSSCGVLWLDYGQ